MGGSDVNRLGFWSAVLVTVWVLLFGLFMALGLFGISTGPLPFLVSLLLAPSFVVMMTSIHYQTAVEKRIWSQLGLAFAMIYAVLVASTYYVQLTAVRNAADDALRPFVYAPGTVFFAVDMLGYAFMCLSTWFAAPAFATGDRLSTWIRRLFILHGVLVFPTLIAPAFMTSAPASSEGAGSSAGILALLAWCMIFVPLALLVARYFRRQQAREGMAVLRSAQ